MFKYEVEEGLKESFIAEVLERSIARGSTVMGTVMTL